MNVAADIWISVMVPFSWQAAMLFHMGKAQPSTTLK